MDLVGDDVTNQRRLIVENQLEPTDHIHLGQLLTYAGGLDAATIVWISTAVREEHRQALDWLNRHTDEEVAFFGVALEVVRIGDSPAAVNFKPVAVPNDWGRSVKRAAEQSEPSGLAQSRQRFFEQALAELKQRHPGLTNAARVGLANWFPTAGGRTGFGINWTFTGDRHLRTELYIDTGSGPDNKGLFRALTAHRDAVENELGPITWDALPTKKAVRIYTGRPVGVVPIDDDEDLRSWAVERMAAFHRVFRPLIRTIAPLPEPLVAPDESPAGGLDS